MHIYWNACMLVFLRWGFFTSSFSIIILKETIYIKTFIQTILIKTIIQIDKHKANTTKTLFSNIKKAYLRISKYLTQIFFAYPLFQIIKKVYLQISKPWHSFFTHPLFKYKKKHTYESQHTWHSFFTDPLLNIKKADLWISKYLAQFFCLSPF